MTVQQTARRPRRRRHRRSKAATRRSEERLKEARESFAEAFEQLRSEQRFRGWLEAQRSLHRYSLRNVLWIVSQMPGATYVAPYKRWKEELGYQVRRGERSLKIWVRRTRKVTEEDPETGEEAEVRKAYYVIGGVFDRSQVDPIPGEAKPLSPPAPAKIDGDSHAWAIARLERFAAGLGFEVRHLELPPGKDGFYDVEGRVVGVSEGLAANAQVHVIAHECAHALGVGYERYGRGRAEVIVDCAAHIVCARIGLDIGAATVPYVASWAKEDSEVIVRDANEIDRLAATILCDAGLEREREESRGAG